MKKTSRKILFFGNEQLATGVSSDQPTLKALKKAGYEVVHIESKQLDKSELLDEQAEVGVLIAYGKIIPAEVIKLFPKGIVNVHPSLLPLYRGSTPIESTILDGADETGVSLMMLSSAMDAGPVYKQRKVNIEGNETKQSLADKLSKLGSEMVSESLPAILDGSLKPIPQDESQATFTRKIEKEDGQLDWSKRALQLEREVRAYAGWPRSQTILNGVDLIVTGAHVRDGRGESGHTWHSSKQFGVYTADGILVIDRLIPAGKQEMSAEAFLAGYKLN